MHRIIEEEIYIYRYCNSDAQLKYLCKIENKPVTFQNKQTYVKYSYY